MWMLWRATQGCIVQNNSPQDCLLLARRLKVRSVEEDFRRRVRRINRLLLLNIIPTTNSSWQSGCFSPR
jgi:hypothetical protein